MRVAIIGAGLIGNKRAQALPRGVTLSWVCDINPHSAKTMAEKFACRHTDSAKTVFHDSNVDAVIIATTNQFLSPLAAEAIKHNKHVLIEKPGAKNFKDIRHIRNAYTHHRRVVMFGYNHRYHPSFIRLKKIVDSGRYGKLLFIRARYGHGGRLGYEKEWRFDPISSGGGELLDQGSHLIDLTHYLFGTMKPISAATANFFWKAELEDSAFFLMKNKTGALAQMSVSCVEWKNLFYYEIMLERAKLQVSGLGRSYGKEILTIYQMKPELGPPNIREYDLTETEDLSWKRENAVFFNRIRRQNYSPINLKEAEAVLANIHEIYRLAGLDL